MNNLSIIKKWMKNNQIDIFLINRTDEFLSEYIAPYAERLFWISDFSGSAGRAIISSKQATIFVDGRYTFQARQEINRKYFNIKKLENYWKFIENTFRDKIIVGLDSSLHSITEVNRLQKIADHNNTTIKFFEKNPIDKYWQNQPKYPNSHAFVLDKKYAGRSCGKKLLNIQSKINFENIDFFLLTSLESIAWLLNIRSKDILYIPVVLSYAIISKNKKIELFVDLKKISKIKSTLSKNINFNSIKDLNYFFNKNKNKVLAFDENRTSYSFKKKCIDNKISTINLSDPCLYPKALKNVVEQAGAKKANMRDGLSITKYIYWLKNKMKINNHDEIKAANYLLNLRKKNDLFFSPSFDTISAINENAALPHYRMNSDSNLSFKKNCIYLFDSGAQYYDGTTDITRTIIVGEPTDEQKDRFTRVLKGHIAIATAKFKDNTKGSKIDPLARKSLQEIELDYDHGTGHGIGSFLSVHEGPQRISKLASTNEGKISKGMILSNEPGFYKKGEYGIRTENLLLVVKSSKYYLSFETISFAPIDLDLIDQSLLNKKEINWLNNYHKKVYKNYGSKLNKDERKWLLQATKSL